MNVKSDILALLYFFRDVTTLRSVNYKISLAVFKTYFIFSKTQRLTSLSQ